MTHPDPYLAPELKQGDSWQCYRCQCVYLLEPNADGDHVRCDRCGKPFWHTERPNKLIRMGMWPPPK
jgi:PHP family Zn ribbon phosphoesterase